MTCISTSADAFESFENGFSTTFFILWSYDFFILWSYCMLLLICADPSPWLCVSDAIKEKNKNKPYDPKKSVWVPNKVGHVYRELKGTASQYNNIC